MNKWIASGLVSLVLLVVGVSAQAQDNQDAQEAEALVNSIVSAPIRITGDDKDYFHVWMSQVYGTFIFAPWDDQYEDGTITVLSKALGFTNILAIILGVVIIYYVYIAGAVNTAYQGEVLGKGWSSIWIPIRTMVGFFLVTPMTAVGGGVLSFAQVFIIWLIMLGSNSASLLWNYVVEEMLSGTPITAPASPTGVAFTRDVLQILVCTEHYVRYHGRDDADGRVVVLSETREFVPPPTYSGNYYSASTYNRVELARINATQGDDGYTILNANIGDTMRSSGNIRYEFGMDGDCGAIDFTNDGEDDAQVMGGVDSGDYKSEAMKEGMEKARSDIATLVNALVPIAVQIASRNPEAKAINQARHDPTETSSQSETYRELFKEWSTKVARAHVEFSDNLMTNIHVEVSGSDALQEAWRENMGKGGWGSAGVWYYEIASLPALSRSVFDSVLGGVSAETPSFCSMLSAWTGWFSSRCEPEEERLASSYAVLNSVILDMTNDRSNGIDDASGALLVSCSAGGTCDSAEGSAGALSARLARTTLNHLADGRPVGDTGGISSPFTTVSSIGHSLNTYAVSAWAMVGAFWVGSEIMDVYKHNKGGVASRMANAFGSSVIWATLKGTFEYASVTLMGMVTILFATGFTLAYLVPFLPVITWILQVSGYLISTAEAVVASPLAIIQMVTPEGEGISGTRLERSMNLLAVVILKPSLMIIGIVASITIGSVAFGILNEFFFIATEYVLYGSVIDFFAILIIYTMLVLQLCKLVIGVMHTFDRQILQWFSSGYGGSFGEQEIGGAVEGGTGNMKEMAGQIGGSVKGGIAEKKKAKADSDKGSE